MTGEGRSAMTGEGLLRLAANLFWNATLTNRAPVVPALHDLIGALEAQHVRFSRGRRVVLLRVDIHLRRIAAQCEHRREAHDVPWQQSRTLRGHAFASDRRLAGSLDCAAPSELGGHCLR